MLYKYLTSVKFHSASLCGRFWVTWNFWEKCTEWAQNDLEHSKVKGTSKNATTTPNSQISLRFSIWPVVFELQAILRQVHQMTPKRLYFAIFGHETWPLALHTLQLPSSPKFHSVLLYGQRFSRQVHRMTPKMILNTKRLQLPQSPKFHSILASRFRVKGHFETSALNDPNMTLNTKKIKIHHISCCIRPESQISLHCALWPAAFVSQAILRQIHQMTPKWP